MVSVRVNACGASATRRGGPPDFATAQIDFWSPMTRKKKRSVEFIARTSWRPVPSLGNSVTSSGTKVAVTLRSPCAVAEQVADAPLQAPPQPWKRAFDAADAVNVTADPIGRRTSQVVAPLPQSMPGPLTWPGPVTATVTCAGGAGGGGAGGGGAGGGGAGGGGAGGGGAGGWSGWRRSGWRRSGWRRCRWRWSGRQRRWRRRGLVDRVEMRHHLRVGA